MSAPKESRRRLFFALWPTPAMQEALAAAASRTIESLRSGRPVPRENLHLTLAFLGSVPESSLSVLEETARRLALEDAARRAPLEEAARPIPLDETARRIDRPSALTLTFDAIEYWARSEILCAAARQYPNEASEAAALAETLKQWLLAGGFAPDLKPFRPHVTLARQVRRCPRERSLPEVAWTFSDFALIESRSTPVGSLYSIVASWPLYSRQKDR